MSRSVVFRRDFFRRISQFVGSSLLSLLLQPSVLANQDVTLTWNPSKDSSAVGYKLYFGLESYNYTTWVDVGNVTQATVALPDGISTFFFAATTYDRNGNESDFSDETMIHPSTSGTTAPMNSITQANMAGGVFDFTVNGATGTQQVVEASTDLVNWVPVATNAAPFVFSDPDSGHFSQRFYRTRPL